MRGARFSRRIIPVKRFLFLAAGTALGTLALTACGAILGSFEVDPNSDGGASSTSSGSSSGGSSSGGSSSGGSSSGGSSSGDAAIDAPKCTAPLVACGAACVDLDKDDKNCGKCGRVCGARCSKGVCDPSKVISGTDTINGIAPTGPQVFFTAGSRVLACPAAGCPATPQQLVTMSYPANGIVTTAGTVVFQSAPTQATERPAVFACPLTGCVGVPTFFVQDGLNGFKDPTPVRSGNRVAWNGGGIGMGSADCSAGVCNAPTNVGFKARTTAVDSTHIYYVENLAPNAAIKRCKHGINPCVADTVMSGAFESVDVMTIDGTTLYYVLPGRVGFNEAKLFSCGVNNCAGTLKQLANGLEIPTELVADPSGIYWITKNDQTPASFEIQACAPGCVGGPRSVVKPSTAKALATDADFLYYGEGSVLWRIQK